MGISVPTVVFGYSPSDDVLQIDDTEYNVTTQSYTLLFEGSITLDLITGTKLRFKATMKDDGDTGKAQCHLYIAGTKVETLEESGAVYVTHEADVDFGGYSKGDAIAFYGNKTVRGQCWIKDVSLCGIQSPVIYD